MKKTAALLLVATALVAGLAFGCKDSTSPGPTLDATALVGQWRLTVGPATGCWTGPGTLGWIRLSAQDAAAVSTCSSSGCSLGGSPGSRFFNVVYSRWSWDSTFVSDLPVTGNINLDDRTATLNIWKTYPAHGQIVLTQIDADSMTGTFGDLNHAFALASGCSSSAVLSKLH